MSFATSRRSAEGHVATPEIFAKGSPVAARVIAPVAKEEKHSAVHVAKGSVGPKDSMSFGRSESGAPRIIVERN